MPFADLVAEAPFGEALVEPYELGVGTAAGRQYLDGGWSTRDETDGHGSFVWAVGESSRLRVPILETRDLAVEIELRPFAWQGSPRQSVTFEFAGEDLGTFELAAGPSLVRVEVPKSLQNEDSNELSLRWGWSRRPKDVLGVPDQRDLAAAVYNVRFPGLEARSGDAPRSEGERLWLPAGSRIDFFFDLPESSVLSVDDIGRRGLGRAKLEVQTENSGQAHDSGLIGPELIDPGLIDLPVGIVRIRLEATGPSGGVMLQAPMILVPDTEDEERDESVALPDSDPRDFEPAPSTTNPPPSIVLYSIDTLRADALDLYGGPVPSPTLSRFAQSAWLFEDATAQSSWTKASMASVLTGLLPPAHGALSRQHILAPEKVTLQELLSAAGYQTAAFNTNPNLTAPFGFDQGFDYFHELSEEATAEEVVAEVEAWLGTQRDESRPLFLWVHTLDPHSPYQPPAEARKRWAKEVAPQVAEKSRQLLDDMRAGRIERDAKLLADLRALYQAEAAYSDATFGLFLDVLESRGLDRAAILVLSDHGEEFFEHGNLEHGRALYEESVHIPMMLRLPEGWVPKVPTSNGPDSRGQDIKASGIRAVVSSGRSEEPVQHIDVLPTILELAGLPIPATLPGRSLLVEGDRDLFMHLHLDGAERAGVFRAPYKLLAERGGDGRLGRFRLYDLAQDPGETMNLASDLPLRRGVLAQVLRRSLVTAAAAPEIDLDPEMRRRLEALGYL